MTVESSPHSDRPFAVVACNSDAECERLSTFLADRLYEFNAARTGYHDARYLGGFVRDDQERLVGGFNGHTWGGCCHLSHLWVDEGHRGRGLGSSLLASAEAHARARGCTLIVLATHSFQAPGFYERLGYSRKCAIDGAPNGHADVIYVKALA